MVFVSATGNRSGAFLGQGIRARCLAVPAVDDAAIIGVPNEEFGEEVKAVVKLKPGAGATEAELIEWCNQRVAGYKRPRSVDFVDDFPRDVAGKTQKRRLRDRYWQGLTRRI